MFGFERQLARMECSKYSKTFQAVKTSVEYQLVFFLLAESKGPCFPDDLSAALSELQCIIICPELQFAHNHGAKNN